MNRRSFIQALGIGAGAALVATVCPFPTPVQPLFERLTFKGIPLVFNEQVPTNRIIFLNPNSWVNDGNGWVRRD